MNYFAQMLNSIPAQQEKKKVCRNWITGDAVQMHADSVNRYKAVMQGKDLTTGDIARALNIRVSSAKEILERYKVIGLVESIGREFRNNGTRPYIWRWIG